MTKEISGNFSSALLLAFIVLKLCKVIDWSWWWVFSPLWMPILFLVVAFSVCVLLDKFSNKMQKPIKNKVLITKWLDYLMSLLKQQV